MVTPPMQPVWVLGATYNAESLPVGSRVLMDCRCLLTKCMGQVYVGKSRPKTVDVVTGCPEIPRGKYTIKWGTSVVLISVGSGTIIETLKWMGPTGGPIDERPAALGYNLAPGLREAAKMCPECGGKGKVLLFTSIQPCRTCGHLWEGA